MTTVSTRSRKKAQARPPVEAPPVLYDAAGQSEAVSEVLSQPPASIVRWGTTVLFGALLLLLAGAWFIRYPDVIPGNALITTEQPPLKLLARANGRLTSLLVDDNTFVKRGTLLAEIDNTTRLENIPKLHRFITDARRLLADPTYTLPLLPEGIALGDAQDDYNHIVKSYREHKRLLTDSYHGQQAAMLQQQITDYQQLIDLNERQLVLTEQEYGNAEQKYQTNASLYRQKVHSRLEFLDMENNFLQKKKERETFRKVIVENRLILADKRRQLSEMSYQLLQKTRSHRDNIELHVRDIENALQVWQYTYVLTAPTDGKLIYLSQLVKNQPVRIADTLFAVLPASRQPYVGFVTVPAQGAGKVRVGQWVVIKLNDFPYREYGVLRGRVMKIAPTTTPRTYRLQVSLPNGLVSSYAKTLRFKPEMTGSAEIITDDMRLLERAFHNLRGLAAN